MSSLPDPLEELLSQEASAFAYPKTPEISREVRRRLSGARRRRLLLRTAALALVLLLATVVALPQTRAALTGYFRIGAVEVLPVAATPESQSTSLPTLQPALPEPLLGLIGRTSLEEVREDAPFTLRLPEYPPDLGEPADVYYQSDIPMVVMAWRDPAEAGKIRLSLYQIDSDSFIFSKIEPEIVQETHVGESYALWVKGPYLLQLTNGHFAQRRLVEGHTLVWEQDGVTYRLEAGLPLEEALKIAESLR